MSKFKLKIKRRRETQIFKVLPYYSFIFHHIGYVLIALTILCMLTFVGILLTLAIMGISIYVCLFHFFRDYLDILCI